MSKGYSKRKVLRMSRRAIKFCDVEKGFGLLASQLTSDLRKDLRDYFSGVLLRCFRKEGRDCPSNFYGGLSTSISNCCKKLRGGRARNEREKSNFQTHCAFPDPLGLIVPYGSGNACTASRYYAKLQITARVAILVAGIKNVSKWKKKMGRALCSARSCKHKSLSSRQPPKTLNSLARAAERKRWNNLMGSNSSLSSLRMELHIEAEPPTKFVN
ncbi:hypothetical protein FB451DRAFT_1518136 [Mycena latifolia]|nr:hypothetical protein FB451DRAFT_1518136 [Mycena latifolia]